MAEAPTLRDVVACLEQLYDPHWAYDWDAVGTVCGDPDDEVRSVLFAVDPVLAVVDEAARLGADLLVTHHPLLLRPVHSVAATTPKGQVVHRLIRGGIALHVCHTNADTADPGVSGAMAAAFGLTDVRPLEPAPDAAPDPSGTAAQAATRGAGRVGVLPEPATLREFAEFVAARLPATAGGVRVAGEPDRPVRTVALCGGAGDGFLDLARASRADVYVTSDLRHHPAAELREHAYGGEDGAMALIDVSHWAAEWMWLPEAARRLESALAERGTTVETHVSRVRTDAWQFHVAQRDTDAPDDTEES